MDYFNGGQTYQGLELIAKNGSGDLFIDQSVETIHFQNGQYLAYNDVPSYVAADKSLTNDNVQLAPDGVSPEQELFNGSGRVLLNYNVSDFTLSRDSGGDFVLVFNEQSQVQESIIVSGAVHSIQFLNGQNLAVQDLPSYMKGSGVFTEGTPGDDTLLTATTGDQYISGGAGTDNVYLHGNVNDYTLKAVDLAANGSHQAIDGYELLANNGSGNLYIDQSTEVIHFQNGQYLAFHDLPAYIDPFHG